MLRPVVTISIAATFIALTSIPGAGIESDCVVVKRTSDGFVAMRARPRVNSPMIGKFLQGQLLGISASGAWRGWVRVDYIMKMESGKVVSTELQNDGYISQNLVEHVDCQ